MKNRIFLILIFIPALLSGCFGGDGANVEKAEEGYHYYSTAEFRLQIPNEWEIIKQAELKSDISKNAIIAFRNNVRNARHTANVVVILNNIQQENLPSSDYAKALYAKVRDSLIDFGEISVNVHKMLINGRETDTLYTVSRGRESITSDVLEFYYVSGVDSGRAYTVVGSTTVSEAEQTGKKLETILKSFEIK